MRGCLLWLAALALGVLAFAAVAYAHDDAAWIQANPAYVAASGTHCCGPGHCSRVAPGEIVRIPGGWQHVASGTVLMDGDVGIYPSIDADMWRCFWASKLQCVFPGAGT